METKKTIKRPYKKKYENVRGEIHIYLHISPQSYIPVNCLKNVSIRSQVAFVALHSNIKNDGRKESYIKNHFGRVNTQYYSKCLHQISFAKPTWAIFIFSQQPTLRKKRYTENNNLILIITNSSISVWPKAQSMIVLIEFH